MDGTALIRLGAGDDRYEPPQQDTHVGQVQGELIATTKVIDLDPDEGPQPGPSPQPVAESTLPPPDDTPLMPVFQVQGLLAKP